MKAVGAELVLLFQVALKPGSELGDEPGASTPLYERLVMVTTLPLCENVPFQIDDTVCPLAKEKTRLQPLIVVVPVLVITKVAPKPPAHWLVIA